MSSKRILCFLTASLALGGCAPSIVGIAAGAGASVGVAAEREGGIRSTANDIRIKALISDKWFKYNLETFAKLNLTVDQGRVLLTGIVQNPDARVEAVRLAWQVDGVAQVINEIHVADAESFPDHIQDTWITTRLRTVMTFDRNVQAINYSIDTVDGTVYLMGIAYDQPELDHVVDLARNIPHVKQVVSYVKRAGEPVAGAKPQGAAVQAAPVQSAPVQSVPVQSVGVPPQTPPEASAYHHQAAYAEPDPQAAAHSDGDPDAGGGAEFRVGKAPEQAAPVQLAPVRAEAVETQSLAPQPVEKQPLP